MNRGKTNIYYGLVLYKIRMKRPSYIRIPLEYVEEEKNIEPFGAQNFKETMQPLYRKNDWNDYCCR